MRNDKFVEFTSALEEEFGREASSFRPFREIAGNKPMGLILQLKPQKSGSQGAFPPQAELVPW